MTFKNTTLPALSLALMAGIALLGVSPVAAAEKAKDAVVTAAGKTSESDALLTKLSSEGYAAMRDIKGARLAVFNGKPELAEKMVASASKNLATATKDDTKYAVKTKTAASGSDVVKLVPIDGALFVVDNFKMSPEKKEKIAEANEHLKKGNTKKAIETLRLASIDVAMRRIIMPIGRTTEHVKTAADLLRDHKYYEANLALKAAEDGLIIDTVALDEPVASDKKKDK